MTWFTIFSHVLTLLKWDTHTLHRLKLSPLYHSRIKFFHFPILYNRNNSSMFALFFATFSSIVSWRPWMLPKRSKRFLLNLLFSDLIDTPPTIIRIFILPCSLMFNTFRKFYCFLFNARYKFTVANIVLLTTILEFIMSARCLVIPTCTIFSIYC